VLINGQNLRVPLDRRVWLECLAPRAAGYDVSVFCPMGPGNAAREVIKGVRIYRYPPAPEARGLPGYLREFVYSWVRTASLWKARGVRFVYDQHDLNPELVESRSGHATTLGAMVQFKGLAWLERMTYRIADRVISTNESYRRIAITRGRRRSSDVTVVRSRPDTRRMRPVYPPPGLRGRDYLLACLGIMGPQDGVNLLIDVMDELVIKRGRHDIRLVMLGLGDCLDDLRNETRQRGLDGSITFTGRVGLAEIADYLWAADLGLGPDPKTPLNDVSTMNKTMEYMAFPLPTVSFDLAEVRVSAGETVVYVPSEDITAFADAVEALLEDYERRVNLGMLARERVSRDLDGRPQAQAYLGVFDNLLGLSERTVTDGPSHHEPAPTDRQWVDLDDVQELRRFVRDRHAKTSDRQVVGADVGH
jgi:glycosyltransferase involved in cell wall biosynthesis